MECIFLRRAESGALPRLDWISYLSPTICLIPVTLTLSPFCPKPVLTTPHPPTATSPSAYRRGRQRATSQQGPPLRIKSRVPVNGQCGAVGLVISASTAAARLALHVCSAYCNQGSAFAGTNQACGGANNWGATNMEVRWPKPLLVE